MTSAPSAFAFAADLLDPPPNPYVEHPVDWVHERLSEETWSKQDEIMESVLRNRRTAVKSSHGVGKTHIASRIGCWWLDSHPPGEAFLVTTAPGAAQVKAILWRYIGQAHRKGDLIGRVNQTEWLIGNEPIGFGRKPADPAEGGLDTTVDAFHGVHAKYVLIIMDEAGGIPTPLWTAAKSFMTSRHNRLLVIGNPDDPTSEFERACRDGSGYEVISISTFDTPNFTGERVSTELRDLLPDQVWLDEFIKDFGVGSAVYTAKVLGQFPKDASDAVVPFSWAAQCKKLELDLDPKSIVSMGVDIGGGIDATVITPMQGRVFLPQRVSYSDDPNDAVDEIVQAIADYRPQVMAPVKGITVRVNIEADGLGWGVAGGVERECARRGWTDVQVNAVKVGSGSTDPEQFNNLRSELYWMMRQACHMKRYDLKCLGDNEDESRRDKCINELTTPKWKKGATGLIEVEKRESIIKRLKHSPDRASSLILAPFVPPDAYEVEEEDYDPSAWLTGRR